jgi:hypothetical protein
MTPISRNYYISKTESVPTVMKTSYVTAKIWSEDQTNLKQPSNDEYTCSRRDLDKCLRCMQALYRNDLIGRTKTTMTIW